MKTLREMCKITVIKFGIGDREGLPDSLPEKVRANEAQIQKQLTGQFVEDSPPPIFPKSIYLHLVLE
jgi:hypothetical protein